MQPANQPSPAEPLPFWAEVPVRTSRRGCFWVPGERVSLHRQTYQRGPLFVEWEAPERVTQPYPVVLVHGGTLQGTEWGDTPDGRPGWAQRLVEAGYAVLVVDRPGHGRSPYHAEIIGPMSPPFSYERAKEVYFPDAAADRQTQWPFDPQDASAFDAFMAAYGPIPADLAASQEMDADRLARLLDRIGPAIIITHSASGPAGWLVADRRPGLVRAIVSLEPMGPPFATTPGIGTLAWGLTAAPVAYHPPRATAAEVRAANPATLQLPALAGLPVAVVTGEASAFAAFGPAIVDFLRVAGAAAEHLHLPDHGVRGNGHGLLYEKNSDQALAPVLRWLATHTATASPEPETPKLEVGFIGLGKMGRAMAHNLVQAGHRVRAWNRSLEVLPGVEMVASPREAFQAAVVFTMLADDAAIRAVLLDAGVLPKARAGAVHVVTATISVDFADELRAAHAAAGVGYLSAPVFGRPDVAAAGQLTFMVAGEPALVATVQPLLDVLGKKTWVLGEDPKQANAAKIAGNMMLALVIETLAEAAVLTGSHGLAPETFFALMLQTQFSGSRAYENYSQKIVQGDFEAGFGMKLGLKDLGLATAAAAKTGKQLPLLAAVHAHMAAAVAAGLGEKDWSGMADYTLHQSGEAPNAAPVSKPN